jgi:hypothetical protein
MQKGMFMLENGQMIKPMEMEFILISTEADTMGNGTKINNTVSVSKNGQMVLNMKVAMSKA